ncbi:MAG: hypothetical protein WCP32_17100 [Bacteroidota bacterium]
MIQYLAGLLNGSHNTNASDVELKTGFGGDNFDDGSLFAVFILFGLVGAGVGVVFKLAEGFYGDLLGLGKRGKHQQQKKGKIFFQSDSI